MAAARYSRHRPLPSNRRPRAPLAPPGPARPPPALASRARPNPSRRHLVAGPGPGPCPRGTMFLTTVLLRKRIPGKQWIGKYRRPRVVTLSMKQAMIRRLEIEAENEYWLSRPYLTREQEYNHNREGRRAKWETLKSTMTSKFPEHRYMSDHLNHLNVSKKWTS
nr:ribosomal protein 63, mitochondrial isoform X2 [Anser cygnoides]